MFQAKAIATRVNAFGLDVVYHGRHVQADAAYRYYLALLDMAKDVDILNVAASGGSRRRRLRSRMSPPRLSRPPTSPTRSSSCGSAVTPSNGPTRASST